MLFNIIFTEFPFKRVSLRFTEFGQRPVFRTQITFLEENIFKIIYIYCWREGGGGVYVVA